MNLAKRPAIRRLLHVLVGAVMAAGLALPAAAQGCLSAMGCIRDAEIEDILRDYSDPIFEAAGLNAADIDIYIVNDPSLNAFVAAGLNMSLNTGLIMESATPEELKGVIAHETCHMACGHNITRRQAMDSASGTSLISMGLGVLAIAAGAPDAGMALIGSSSTFAMLTFFKYTRHEESSADQAGLSYLEKTGQSAEGMVSFMEKFRYMELMSEGRRDPYFRSHPISTDRIGALRTRAAEVTAKSSPQSAESIDQLARMKAKLIGFIGPPNKVYNRYPESDQSIHARYARAISAYRTLDIKKGLTGTQELIDEEPNNPYFHELYGQILFEHNRIEESIAPHRRSVELAPQHALLKVNLARSLFNAGGEERIKEAEDLLIDAIVLEPENAFAWNQLSMVYAKQGRKGDADLAVAEEAYILGNMPRAQIFARRALDSRDLEGTNLQRARDISALADPRARGGRPG
jgi:predicted Zn-dependent protease